MDTNIEAETQSIPTLADQLVEMSTGSLTLQEAKPIIARASTTVTRRSEA